MRVITCRIIGLIRLLGWRRRVLAVRLLLGRLRSVTVEIENGCCLAAAADDSYAAHWAHVGGCRVEGGDVVIWSSI